MRVFIDTSGGWEPYWRSGQKGREFLDWLARYSEGDFVAFDTEIVDNNKFGPDNKIVFNNSGRGTDANCLGKTNLEEGDELKVFLTDGYHDPLRFVPRNMLTIHPATIYNPKFLALHLSFLDDELQKMQKMRATT